MATKKKAYEVLRDLQAKDPSFLAGREGRKAAKGDERKNVAKRMAQSLEEYPDTTAVMKKIDQMPKPAPKDDAGKPKVSKKALREEHPKVTAARRKAERKAEKAAKPKKERQPKPKPVVHEFNPKDIERIVDEVMQASGIPAGKKKSYMKFLTAFSKQNDRRQAIRIKLHKVRVAMMEGLVNTLG